MWPILSGFFHFSFMFLRLVYAVVYTSFLFMAAEYSLARREHVTHLFEDLSICPALRSSVSGCLLQDTEGPRSRNCPLGWGLGTRGSQMANNGCVFSLWFFVLIWIIRSFTCHLWATKQLLKLHVVARPRTWCHVESMGSCHVTHVMSFPSEE